MEIMFVFCPQNSYLNPGGSVYMGEQAEILKVRLVDYLSHYHGKTLFFREKRAESDDFFCNDKTHSIVNSFDYHICEELKPHAHTIIDKIRYNAFFETDLEGFLKREKINSVLISGLETQTSILFTAEELRNRGYNVTVIEPLVVSRDVYMHQTSISLMANYLGVKIYE